MISNDFLFVFNDLQLFSIFFNLSNISNDFHYCSMTLFRRLPFAFPCSSIMFNNSLLFFQWFFMIPNDFLLRSNAVQWFFNSVSRCFESLIWFSLISNLLFLLLFNCIQLVSYSFYCFQYFSIISNDPLFFIMLFIDFHWCFKLFSIIYSFSLISYWIWLILHCCSMTFYDT